MKQTETIISITAEPYVRYYKDDLFMSEDEWNALSCPIKSESGYSGRERLYKEVRFTIDLSNIVDFDALLLSLPEDQRRIVDEKKLMELWRHEVEMLDKYGRQAEKPDAHMTPFVKSGSQWIADFWVSDLAKPREERYNWHLQNTSQWRYAGCILYDERDGRVSTHH